MRVNVDEGQKPYLSIVSPQMATFSEARAVDLPDELVERLRVARVEEWEAELAVQHWLTDNLHPAAWKKVG